jgi:hypothetical protein
MVSLITTAPSSLGADLLAVGALGLVVGVSTYGAKKGWRFFKSLTN